MRAAVATSPSFRWLSEKFPHPVVRDPELDHHRGWHITYGTERQHPSLMTGDRIVAVNIRDHTYIVSLILNTNGRQRLARPLVRDLPPYHLLCACRQTSAQQEYYIRFPYPHYPIYNVGLRYVLLFIYFSLTSISFQIPAAQAPPTNGPTMKIQRFVSAVPPWKTAGAIERAGFTLVPVKWMPTR